jgi:hypothetical protein
MTSLIEKRKKMRKRSKRSWTTTKKKKMPTRSYSLKEATPAERPS